MNPLALRRQLTYILCMVGLLVPLFIMGQPSKGTSSDKGGALARIRAKYELGQADLGDIDPASESMRLATLGLRGVAATILWQQAEYYKKEQFWDRLAATLNQIAVLQPHFVEVWKFQSHNLSYNISVEFDDYRQRYQWVKRGIDYLIMGSKYNRKRTEMPYELGWFFGNKMGVADEKKYFRQLYRDDANFHTELAEKSLDVTDQYGLGPDNKPDNWLTGRLYYERSYDMVVEGSKPAKSPLMFYRMSSSWLTKYAEALQAEGNLGDAARVAWRRAAEGIKVFGNMPIQTTFGDEISLNGIAQANEELARARKDFEEYAGEVFQQAREERRKQLTDSEVAALNKDAVDRSFDEILMAQRAEDMMKVDMKEVVTNLPKDKQTRAFQLADRINQAEQYIMHIEVYRNQINYEYWRVRCDAEQEDSAIVARTNMYDANQLLDKGDLDAALKKYEVAWKAWDELFNRFPSMMIDDTAEDIEEAIERYTKLRDDPKLPEDFILNDFLEFRKIHEGQMSDNSLLSVITEWPSRYPGRNFLKEMLKRSRPEPVPQLPIESADPTDATPSTPDAQPAPEEKETAKPEAASQPAAAPDEGTSPIPDPAAAAPAADAGTEAPKAAAPDAGDAPSPTPDNR